MTDEILINNLTVKVADIASVLIFILKKHHPKVVESKTCLAYFKKIQPNHSGISTRQFNQILNTLEREGKLLRVECGGWHAYGIDQHDTKATDWQFEGNPKWASESEHMFLFKRNQRVGVIKTGLPTIKNFPSFRDGNESQQNVMPVQLQIPPPPDDLHSFKTPDIQCFDFTMSEDPICKPFVVESQRFIERKIKEDVENERKFKESLRLTTSTSEHAIEQKQRSEVSSSRTFCSSPVLVKMNNYMFETATQTFAIVEERKKFNDLTRMERKSFVDQETKCERSVASFIHEVSLLQITNNVPFTQDFMKNESVICLPIHNKIEKFTTALARFQIVKNEFEPEDDIMQLLINSQKKTLLNESTNWSNSKLNKNGIVEVEGEKFVFILCGYRMNKNELKRFAIIEELSGNQIINQAPSLKNIYDHCIDVLGFGVTSSNVYIFLNLPRNNDPTCSDFTKFRVELESSFMDFSKLYVENGGILRKQFSRISHVVWKYDQLARCTTIDLYLVVEANISCPIKPDFDKIEQIIPSLIQTKKSCTILIYDNRRNASLNFMGVMIDSNVGSDGVMIEV